MESVKLTVDGHPVEVTRGATIRQAALLAGIHVPTLCHHDRLHCASNCRVCVVEVEGARTLVPSCSNPAREGMAVLTSTARVRHARRMVLELLMTESDTSAAPELLAYARYYGANSARYPAVQKAAEGRQPLVDNPFFVRDYAKCIACMRCVRACGSDIQHQWAIAMTGHGHQTSVGAGGEGDDLSQSPCVFCGNCVGLCPTGALMPLPELAARQQGRVTTPALSWSPETGLYPSPQAGAPDSRATGPVAAAPTVTTTTCSYCGVGCTLELHTESNRIFKVTSPADAPANQGNLCVKGRFGYDYVHSPDRLTQPLIRRGGKPGARRGTPDFGTLEPATWDEALALVAQRLGEIKAQRGPDALMGFSSAKCTNEENYLFQKFIRAAVGTHNVDHCARLCHASSVVAVTMALGSAAMSNSIGEIRREIDCILVTGHNTTENHPIVGLEMKAAVARGANLILIDPREIELSQFATYHLRHRPGTDVAVFNAMANVIIHEDLVNHPFVGARTEGFAALAAAVEPCTPEWAEEISGVPADLIRAAASLYAQSRNSGIYWGMGITQHHTGTQAALSLCNLALLTGQIGRPGTGLNPVRGQNNVQGAGDMGALPNSLPGYMAASDEASLEKWGQAWGIRLPRTRGLTATDAVAAMGEGKVRGLYVLGENPLMTDPNLNHARTCFEELEFLAVQDIFLTETAAMADVLLPGSAFAEKEGTYTNTERRVQRVRKAVEPPGSARPDWQILCDLASRLGYPMLYGGAADIWTEISGLIPSFRGITWARLQSGPGLQWPCPDEKHPGTRFLHQDAFPRGKGKLHPVSYEPPAEEPDEYYPYVLTTGRVLFHWHSGVMSRRAEGLEAIAPEALVEIHPDDAIGLGLQDAQPVRVSSRRGQVTAKALVTTRPLPGSIFMTFHYAEAAANLLTIDSLDPLARIPEFKVCAVRLEPVPQ